MRDCEYDKCSNQFDPSAHNQKFCSEECLKTSTNERLMRNYYDRKARLSGETRTCEVCDANLSRYNDRNICAKCKASRDKRHLDMLNRLRHGPGFTY